MILKNKIVFNSDRFHSINKIIAFCNQIRNRYAIYKINKKFPFLYLLKIKPITNISLRIRIQVYNIESKKPQIISSRNAKAIYRRVSVLLFAHSNTNLVVNRMQKNVSIKKISILNSLNSSNTNIHYLFKNNLKNPAFIEKNTLKSRNELKKIKFLSIHDVQAVSKYSRVSITTSPISSNIINLSKILSNELQANISISHLSSHINKSESELMNKFMQIKTEFIFLNPNKQLDEIRHAIQKQINGEQPKEKVVSVILNKDKKDRDVLKSRDFQNIVDQIYKLILKRWQKDLERRGIFHA